MRRVVPAGSLTVLAALIATLGLTACTSTTDGTGTSASTPGRTTVPASTSAGSGGPPSSGTGNSTSGDTATPTATPKGRLTVTGASSHVAYDITVWDHDDITDCSTHAYGEAMIRFLGAHPCRGAHRVLGTVPLDGRTVAISAITTSFPGTPADPYGTTAQFIKLEQADNTGAINDLLREGGTLPGALNIPTNEAFTVLSQDAGVTVFDAWYLTGKTADQDPALVTLEQNLFLTAFTNA